MFESLVGKRVALTLVVRPCDTSASVFVGVLLGIDPVAFGVWVEFAENTGFADKGAKYFFPFAQIRCVSEAGAK